MKLPDFKYHPNPISSGSLEDSDATCRCCGEARGLIYTGPAYCKEELFQCLCPWCIADGSAHEKFDCEFTDSSAIGGFGRWCEVPDEVIEEVAHRTPGFNSIQEARWWTHCGDAAQFLGIDDDGGQFAYVMFRCLQCGKKGRYKDFD